MDTRHLKLPYLMPSQAQKHVTHNEALLVLDFIVQLAVESRDLATPPESPGEGDRHIVGTNADGEWLGHDGEVACMIDGGWRCLVPRDGWLAWVRDEGRLYVRRDGGWHSVAENLTSLGVNATPDAVNKLAVASPASLFTHDGGDHQLTVNKADAPARATLVFQSGYEGRAEIGLVGDDDLVFKVSADGANFVEALRVDKASGDVCLGSLNSGPLAGFRNAVINGTGAINQRGFPGGALAGYGYDRWRSEGSGCTVSVAAGRFTLTGAISQTIENARLAGSVVTISVDAPSNPLHVTLGSKSGTIPAGSGRRHVTLSLGTGEPDNLKLVIEVTSSTSFGEVQVERGPRPTPFEARPAALEEVLCRRYFEAVHPVFSGATVSGAPSGSSRPIPWRNASCRWFRSIRSSSRQACRRSRPPIRPAG
ncbi:DUF2793 domain-containing protein [Mesorhizobium sp. CAU 1732]|uniref:DUF2793 domain-containing protein n=1 Tax=Mesorhizobium sp. CAU 1732 TaxID=3140358 RepID=UPI00326103FD